MNKLIRVVPRKGKKFSYRSDLPDRYYLLQVNGDGLNSTSGQMEKAELLHASSTTYIYTDHGG